MKATSMKSASTKSAANPGSGAGRLRRREDRRGVALLFVISTVMLLTVLVTDIGYSSRVRFLMAAHERDEAQARWLSVTGVNLYRLILITNMQLASNTQMKSFAEMAGQYMGKSVALGDLLWSMVPTINTGLLRLVFASGSSIDEEDAAEFNATGTVSDEVREKSVEQSSRFGKKAFLDFDGDFSAEVVGEDCRLNVNMLGTEQAVNGDWTQTASVRLLYALMSGEENEQFLSERNLDRYDLIGNLKDWVDTDNMVSTGKGGYEDDYYNRQASPYLAKNAPFDTHDEIRLVEGWQDEVYERWGSQLSVYGSKKIDINCADTEVIKAMLKAYVTPPPTDTDADNIIVELNNYRLEASMSKASDFCTWLKNSGHELVSNDLCQQLSVSNKTFTVTSTGQVRDAAATVTAVITFTSSSTGSTGTDDSKSGRIVYWRVD